MNDYRPYKPTEAERDEASRLALNAAHEAMRPVMNSDISLKDATIVFLRAFDAANAAVKTYGRELLAKNDGYNAASLYADTGVIVCSALFALENDCLAETAPVSVAGCRLVALIKAARAMEAISVFDGALDEDPGLSDYSAGSALKLAMQG